MSAITQNYTYNFGRKRADKEEHVLSMDKLKEIKESVGKYLSEKK